MTTFEALVCMSQTLICARGEWHGGATAYADMDTAVNQISDLMPNGTRQLCEMAIAELKRRAGATDDPASMSATDAVNATYGAARVDTSKFRRT